MKQLSEFITSLVIVIIYWLVTGYCMKLMYGWFMMTQFSMPDLKLANFIGIAMLTDLLLLRIYTGLSANVDASKNSPSQSITRSIYALISALFTTLLGYIVHLAL